MSNVSEAMLPASDGKKIHLLL